MAKIIINRNEAQITEESDFGLLTDLDNLLSFKIPGAEYSKAFKGFVNKSGKFSRWDGIQRVMTSNLKFPVGLVPKVQRFYVERGVEFTTENISPPLTPGVPIDIMPRLKELGMEPYDYQLDIVKIACENLRGIVRAPTGSGKSLQIACIIAKIGKPSIVYVIGSSLLHQFYKLFCNIFGDDKVGIVGDGLCNIKEINIVSIWSCGGAMGLKSSEILIDSDDDEKSLSEDKNVDILKMIESSKVHIIDECHMAACNTIQQVFKRAKLSEHVLGFSGSPWRDDNADILIEGILGEYIVDLHASTLIEQGFLAQPIIKFIQVPQLNFKPKNNYQSVYKSYIIDNPVRNNLVVKSTKSLVNLGYQTLVLFNNISHGKILYKLINAEIDCELIDGGDDQVRRQEVLAKLASGELRCVLASRIADIGLDVPSLSGLVLAGGGRSTVRAIQRIGRVIRKYPGKKQAAIVDFFDQSRWLDKHSKIRFKVYKSEKGFEVSWPKKK